MGRNGSKRATAKQALVERERIERERANDKAIYLAFPACDAAPACHVCNFLTERVAPVQARLAQLWRDAPELANGITKAIADLRLQAEAVAAHHTRDRYASWLKRVEAEHIDEEGPIIARYVAVNSYVREEDDRIEALGKTLGDVRLLYDPSLANEHHEAAGTDTPRA
jgi:hypothetical protein